MRKPVVLCLAVAMLLAIALHAAPQARAADVKLVGAVSLSGYDNLKADLDLIGGMVGRPELGAMVNGLIALGTHGRGLQGIDRTRPCGILVGTDGKHVGGCAFIPVTDMDAAMDLVKRLARERVEEHENGLYEIKGPDKSVYVQEKHEGWAFIVDDPALLEYVPADPAGALEGLPDEYAVALRLNPANVPAEMRKGVARKVREHARRHLKRRPRETDEQYDARKAIARHIRRQLAIGARDLESMTVGWKVDGEGRKTVLEAAFVSKERSDTARFLAPAAKTRTAFGGFALRNAALTVRGTGRKLPMSAGAIDQLIDAWRDRAFERIDRPAKDDAETVKGLVDKLLEVVGDTAKAPVDDGALSVRLDPEAITLIHGRFVTDGAALEAVVKEAVGLAREKRPETVDRIVQLDAASVGRVNLHVVSIPLEKCPHSEAIQEAVGEKLDIVLGFGPRAVYVAAGRDAMRALRRAIGRSRKAARRTVPPIEVTLDAAALAASAAGCPVERVQARGEKALEVLEKAEGPNQIRFTVEAVERGLKLRLEHDEGVLRLMAEMAKHKK